jgi:ring-1,2-phenylacetyl-CoA epoxidase subunit PaaD
MTEADVIDAIKKVYDPCAVSAQAPVSIYDMGLITGLEIQPEGRVFLKIRPTQLGCTLMAFIMQAVDDSVMTVAGVSEVNLSLDVHSDWSEAEMTEEGKRILHARRSRSREEVPVRRREWEARSRGPQHTRSEQV